MLLYHEVWQMFSMKNTVVMCVHTSPVLSHTIKHDNGILLCSSKCGNKNIASYIMPCKLNLPVITELNVSTSL